MRNDLLTAAIEDISIRVADCLTENQSFSSGFRGVPWRELAGDILNARASDLLSSLPAETLVLVRDGEVNVPAIIEGVESACAELWENNEDLPLPLAKPIPARIAHIISLWRKAARAGVVDKPIRSALLSFCSDQLSRPVSCLESLTAADCLRISNSLKQMKRPG